MKYLKMVIRLVLLIAISPAWMLLLMIFVIGETIEIFLAWLSENTATWKYHCTKGLSMDLYKWVRGG